MNAGKLPIGIQSFKEIRTRGYLYVDKTPFIAQMFTAGKYYFLSRPRRFGKSLFVDTLDCAFSGKEELFRGLYLAEEEAAWDFHTAYPILRIDFAGGIMKTPEELRERLFRMITTWEELYHTRKTEGTPGERLLSLVPDIVHTTGSQVVILIDEYDKPMLDNLDNIPLAIAMRETLKDFYSAIKPLDEHLRFVFLTGVSKFAKAGIFSGLNNLKDITLEMRYSAICGYTEKDLMETFSERIPSASLPLLSAWYNGYSWTGESVYNPFDILLYLDEGVNRPYWFETGTPSFLVTLLNKKPRNLPELDNLLAGEELLSSSDIEDVRPESLLFQTGYLTIKGETFAGSKRLYYVGFPNLEVKSAFSQLMLTSLTEKGNISANQVRLANLLSAGDMGGLKEVFHSFFASIPHDWYRKNQISGFEGYYASIVYAYVASLGYLVIPEDTTNHGQVDMTVQTPDGIWLFEFKVQGQTNRGAFQKSPLLQLQEKRYAEKYRSCGKPIYLVGIVFDPVQRNIVQWETEKITE